MFERKKINKVYTIPNQAKPCFIITTFVDWIDVYTR
jgi:hypothetical protein